MDQAVAGHPAETSITLSAATREWRLGEADVQDEVAYPATVLALATAVSYPPPHALFGASPPHAGDSQVTFPLTVLSPPLR